MTEEQTPQSTEPQTFGWVAGVPAGLQEHPDNKRKTPQQPVENTENP